MSVLDTFVVVWNQQTCSDCLVHLQACQILDNGVRDNQWTLGGANAEFSYDGTNVIATYIGIDSIGTKRYLFRVSIIPFTFHFSPFSS